MKLTWQHLVLVAVLMASILLSVRLGSVALAAISAVVTTVIGTFLRSPQDAKELQ